MDEALIKDPTASKPDDWDESAPTTIPDPNAEKPKVRWLDGALDLTLGCTLGCTACACARIRPNSDSGRNRARPIPELIPLDSRK